MMVLCSEFAIHFVIWGGGVAYSVYRILLRSSETYQYGKVYGDFAEGWKYIGREKDTSDYEWEILLKFIYAIIPWLLFYISISEYLRNRFKKILPYWQIALSIFALFYFLNWLGIILVLSQPFMYELFKVLNGKRVYICTGVGLFLTHLFKSLAYTTTIRHHINDTQHFLIVLILSWMILKCHNYYSTVTENHHFIKALSYFLHIPTAVLGPFISYKDFFRCQQEPKQALNTRICALVVNLLRFAFWALFVEFSLHYFYINALKFHPEIVASLSWWELCGYGYSMGQLFHLQYLVYYGISTSVCRFEEIATPRTPRCIGGIAFYSDMWRYFDQGLHNFLIRHIYILMLKKTDNKAVASLCSFLFVYLWHGIQLNIFIWSMLNLVGLFIEQIFKEMYKSEIIVKSLDVKWRNRLFCLCCSPSLALSAISNFYFFTNVEIGNIFVQHFLQGSAKELLILMVFLYSCCQISMRFSNFTGINKSKME